MNEIKFVDVSNNNQPIEIDIKQDGGPVRWCTPKKPYRFRICPKVSALRIERLRFGTDETGHEWLVHDVAIGGVSAFVPPPTYASDKCDAPHSNTLPGDLFATGAIDSFVSYGSIRGGADVVIDVSYNGPNPEGQPLGLIVECVVEHDLHRVHQQFGDGAVMLHQQLGSEAKTLLQNWEEIARMWKHAHVMLGPASRNVTSLELERAENQARSGDPSSSRSPSRAYSRQSASSSRLRTGRWRTGTSATSRSATAACTSSADRSRARCSRTTLSRVALVQPASKEVRWATRSASQTTSSRSAVAERFRGRRSF